MNTLSKEDIVRLDSESGLYVYHNGDADIEQLQAFASLARADLVAENERLKSIPMKYRRMAFNAELQDETDKLRTALAAATNLLINLVNSSKISRCYFEADWNAAEAYIDNFLNPQE